MKDEGDRRYTAADIQALVDRYKDVLGCYDSRYLVRDRAGEQRRFYLVDLDSVPPRCTCGAADHCCHQELVLGVLGETESIGRTRLELHQPGRVYCPECSQAQLIFLGGGIFDVSVCPACGFGRLTTYARGAQHHYGNGRGRHGPACTLRAAGASWQQL
jgi:hypothetical protein